MENPYIILKNITKIYKTPFGKGTKALDNINLEVRSNEFLGIVGPNGAGKTTLLSIMAGTIRKTNGKIYFDKIRIGYVPEHPPFYENISAEENLLYFAKIDKIKDPNNTVKKILKMVDLYDWRSMKPSEFSNGMRKRLAIGRALLRNSNLLIMDEPFAGLDPSGAIKIKDFLKSLKNEKVSLVISSHNLSYVDLLCDRIIFIKRGRLVKGISKDDLYNKGYLTVYCKYPSKILKMFQNAHVFNNGLKFSEVHKDNVSSIVKTLVINGAEIYQVKFERYNVEDEYYTVFLGGG